MENKKNIDLIIQKITGLSKGQLFLNPKVDPKYEKDINLAIDRLKNWEPIEYIINNAEFYSLDFYVTSDTLIPRNDTEIMVDKTIEEVVTIPKHPDKITNISYIDVWTWTSCIPISILKNTEKIDNCFVIDISDKALKISKINIENYKLNKKINQIHWDLLTNFLINNNDYKLNKNVVITANLPYIKDNDHNNMDSETIKFEPDLALYWWRDSWFELYIQLIKECFLLKTNYNIKNLILFIEIGFDQKEICEKYLKEKWLKSTIFKDNWNIERCVKIEF